ncbi:hypothetical protein BDV10DRAFT_201057, partial [Aspergillus recurvatus]
FPQLDTGHVSGSSESHRPLSQGGHVSSFTLECAVGTFFHPFIDDRFGRQKAIFIGFIRTLLGEALSCSSFQLRQLFIGRFISGMSLGVFSTMVPVWQSECSPATNRDRRVVIDGIFIASGYAVIYRTRDGFSRILRHDITWRVSLAIPGMLSIVLCAAIFFFLESARWLVYVGNVKKATAKLAQLRGVHGGAGLDKIGREIAAIEVSRDHRVQGLLVQGHLTVENGKLFYRCMLCIGLQFSIQMAGAQAISTYSATIFQQKLGFSNGIARIAAASAVAWKLLASFISLLTIDFFGSNNRGPSIASIFIDFPSNFFFPIGSLGPSFLYCTEVASSRLRMPVTSISTANQWLCQPLALGGKNG